MRLWEKNFKTIQRHFLFRTTPFSVLWCTNLLFVYSSQPYLVSTYHGKQKDQSWPQSVPFEPLGQGLAGRRYCQCFTDDNWSQGWVSTARMPSSRRKVQWNRLYFVWGGWATQAVLHNCCSYTLCSMNPMQIFVSISWCFWLVPSCFFVPSVPLHEFHLCSWSEVNIVLVTNQRKRFASWCH